MNIKKVIFTYLITTIVTTSFFCLPKTVTVFSHGIAAKGKQALPYFNDRRLINTPCVTFNYPDATNRFYRVNYNETSFGQENEIGRLYKAYQNTLLRFEDDCDVILYGLSRGASNVCIFAGLYQLDNVKALVLESPYFTLADVIEDIMRKKGFAWLPLSYGQTLVEFIFKKYTRYGYSPANCIENISHDIPIFIVCSQEDHLVPHASSINVYKKLVESGHQHVYIFVADYGKHAAILQGPDGEKYQWVINAFYKKYNLAHCAASAAHGESLLALCQPTFE